jgi:hypothetical protein
MAIPGGEQNAVQQIPVVRLISGYDRVRAVPISIYIGSRLPFTFVVSGISGIENRTVCAMVGLNSGA